MYIMGNILTMQNSAPKISKHLTQVSVCRNLCDKCQCVSSCDLATPPQKKKETTVKEGRNFSKGFDGVARVARVASTKLERLSFFYPSINFRRMGHGDEDEVCYGLFLFIFLGLRGSSGTSQILFFSRWVMMMVIVDCNSLRMSLTFRAICKCFS